VPARYDNCRPLLRVIYSILTMSSYGFDAIYLPQHQSILNNASNCGLCFGKNLKSAPSRTNNSVIQFVCIIGIKIKGRYR